MTRGQLRVELTRIRDVVESLLKALDDAPSPEPSGSLVAGGEAFQGKPIEAKFPGKCGVCGGSYAAGDHVVLRDEKPRTAHLGCGTAAPRGHR